MKRPCFSRQVMNALSDIRQPPGKRPLGNVDLHAHQPDRIATPHMGQDLLFLLG